MVNAHSFKAQIPPGTKPEKIIRVEHKIWERFCKHNTTDFMNLMTCFQVIRKPGKIFTDLKRPYSDSKDFLCICGRPTHWYIRGKKRVQFPEDLVFLVFLNDRYSIYEFGAESLEGDDEFNPENFGWRFGEEIKWKKNS